MMGSTRPLVNPPKPNGGRPRLPDRGSLAGIVVVLRTGCPWRLLPKELGCGSGTTCWRRLRDWREAGVWERPHTRLLSWMGDEVDIDRSRASVDSLSVRAKGAEQTGPRPTDRGTPGSQYHLVVDRGGIQLAVRLSAATAPTELGPVGRRHPPRLSGHVGNPVGPGSAQPSSTPTRATTTPPYDALSVSTASPRSSPGWGLT